MTDLYIRKKALHAILVSLREQLLRVDNEYNKLVDAGVIEVTCHIGSPLKLANDLDNIIHRVKISRAEIAAHEVEIIGTEVVR